MINAKDLDKHPVRYGMQYLYKLLEQQSKQQMFEQLTFTIMNNSLLVTCKSDETYQVLKNCELLLDKDFITRLGLQSFVFQYDKNFLVLKIIRDFIKEGSTEFTFESILEKVNAYSPARTPQAIKEVLTFFASDISDSKSSLSKFSPELLELRGLQPLVKNLRNGTYQILAKIKTKPTPTKKPTRKR